MCFYKYFKQCSGYGSVILDLKIGIVNTKYSTEVYDKRDGFNFKIINFMFLCSNIPSGSAYGYIFPS